MNLAACVRARAVVFAAAFASVAPACREEKPPSPSEARTLAKLKEEVDRLGPHGAADAESPNAKLKALVAGERPTQEVLGARKLPSPNPTVHVGTVAVKLGSLAVDHTVGAGKVSVTSEDVFVHIQLAAWNVAPKPATVDFAFAVLADGAGNTFALAPDAQKLAGSRELRIVLSAGEPKELHLYFEAPLAAVDKGLSLVFPPAVGGEVEVRISLDQKD
jgi:hypothetical protein